MSGPDSPDYIQAHLAEELLLTLQSKTGIVLSDIAALFESGAIEDETDRRFVAEAVKFIENPTENLSDIMLHTTEIGQILGGYEMQEKNAPSEIDAMHAYLLTLQCINRINFVEKSLEQGSPYSSEIQHAMVLALDWATILSRGYQDNTLLSAVNELQGILNSL